MQTSSFTALIPLWPIVNNLVNNRGRGSRAMDKYRHQLGNCKRISLCTFSGLIEDITSAV